MPDAPHFSRAALASAGLALLGAVVLLPGCNSSSGSNYPSGGMHPSNSAPQSPTVLQVPAGARLVAAASNPPLPSFTLSEPGVLYIYDATTQKVAKVTTIGNTQSPVNLSSMPDVGAVLNTSDQYQVYFVPMNQATTLPAPLGGGS